MAMRPCTILVFIFSLIPCTISGNVGPGRLYLLDTIEDLGPVNVTGSLLDCCNACEVAHPGTQMFNYARHEPGSSRPAKCYCSKSIPGKPPVAQAPNIIGNCGQSALFPDQAIANWKMLIQHNFKEVGRATVNDGDKCCQECTKIDNDTQSFLFSNVYSAAPKTPLFNLNAHELAYSYSNQCLCYKEMHVGEKGKSDMDFVDAMYASGVCDISVLSQPEVEVTSTEESSSNMQSSSTETPIQTEKEVIVSSSGPSNEIQSYCMGKYIQDGRHNGFPLFRKVNPVVTRGPIKHMRYLYVDGDDNWAISSNVSTPAVNIYSPEQAKPCPNTTTLCHFGSNWKYYTKDGFRKDKDLQLSHPSSNDTNGSSNLSEEVSIDLETKDMPLVDGIQEDLENVSGLLNQDIALTDTTEDLISKDVGNATELTDISIDPMDELKATINNSTGTDLKDEAKSNTTNEENIIPAPVKMDNTTLDVGPGRLFVVNTTEELGSVNTTGPSSSCCTACKTTYPSTQMFDYQWRIPGSRRPAKCFCSKAVPGVSPRTRPPNVVGNCGDSSLIPEEAISGWKALNQKRFVKVAQAEGVEEASQCCQECSRISNDTQAFLFSNVFSPTLSSEGSNEKPKIPLFKLNAHQLGYYHSKTCLCYKKKPDKAKPRHKYDADFLEATYASGVCGQETELRPPAEIDGSGKLEEGSISPRDNATEGINTSTESSLNPKPGREEGSEESVDNKTELISPVTTDPVKARPYLAILGGLPIRNTSSKSRGVETSYIDDLNNGEFYCGFPKLPFPVYKHATTLLSSGKLLTCGGEYGNRVDRKITADCWTAKQGGDGETWHRHPSLPMPLSLPTLTTLSAGTVFLAGGESETGFSASTWTLNEDEWVPGPDLMHQRRVTGRAGHCAVVWGQPARVLIIGGFNGKYLRTVEEIFPARNESSRLIGLRTGRAYHGCAVVERDNEQVVIVAGGLGKSLKPLDSVEMFAIVRDKEGECYGDCFGNWREVSPLPSGRYGAVAYSMGENVWLFGGGLKYTVEETEEITMTKALRIDATDIVDVDGEEEATGRWTDIMDTITMIFHTAVVVPTCPYSSIDDFINHQDAVA